MSDRELLQTFQEDQPWIIYTYLTQDADIPEEGGNSTILMECAICGETETVILDVPAIGTPGPPPGYQHPQRVTWCQAHVHELQQSAPETWAKPLRNPAAVSQMAMMEIFTDVVHKVRRQVGLEGKETDPDG